MLTKGNQRVAKKWIVLSLLLLMMADVGAAPKQPPREFFVCGWA